MAIVSVAERDVVAVLAVALKPTDAVPLPLAPDVIVSQFAGLLAVQPQPAAALTVTDPLEVAATKDALLADSVGLHATPACVTVNGWLAIVSVADRGALLEFDVALNVTGPVPLPFAPDVIVNQFAGLLAVHPQPVAALTVTDPLEADAASDPLVADSVGVHGVAPSCVTVND